jgi:uncharacterized protein with gpF-like domain
MARRLLDQNRARELRRQNILLDRLEVSFRNRMQSELTRAGLEMAQMFEMTGEVMPPRDHRENVEAAFRAMATEAATVFGARVIDQGKAAGHVLETKDFAATMARLALSYIAGEAVRRHITSIADTTRSQIVSAVARGYADGLGQEGVAKYIRGLVPEFSRYRSALIARTETHGAANFGATSAAKETGLPLRKEWIAAEDARTREDHALADGQIVGMDDAFDVGGASLMYPGDPSGPPEQVINCRCAQGFIVED